MTTGQRVQKARKALGLSQKEFGARLGVSGSMVGQYENDLRNPKRETLQRMADALKVSVDWLCTGQEPEQQVMDRPNIHTDDEIYQLLYFLDLPPKETAKFHKLCTTLTRLLQNMSTADESGADPETVALWAQQYLYFTNEILQSYPEGIYDLQRKYKRWNERSEKIQAIISACDKLGPKSQEKVREYVELLTLAEQQKRPPKRAEGELE